MESEFNLSEREWCICGHRVDEHGRDNNPNLCMGCPCENPTPMWYKIDDINKVIRKLEEETIKKFNKEIDCKFSKVRAKQIINQEIKNIFGVSK